MDFKPYMNQKKSSDIFNSDIISSSELSQFNFCSVAWYLQKCGYEPKSHKINIGKKEHIKIGNIIDKTQKKINRVKNLTRIGYITLFLGILILIFEVFL
jgi:hypothetical protein